MKNNEKTTESAFDIDFLQSEEWRKFQENVGRKTFFTKEGNFSVSIIEHELPVVGKYFYCPRGPISMNNDQRTINNGMQKLIQLAKENNVGWIRIDPENEEALKLVGASTKFKIKKAPHDMQPREIFVVDISKTEDDLLSEMKSKTRYNISIAGKKGVTVRSVNKFENTTDDEAFLKLTKEMAERQGIETHPEKYYKKMIESLPGEMLKLYVAEFDGRIVAANLMLFYGKTATYLHGASGNSDRNVMAPYLLHWQAMLDAKEKGYGLYDFGGVKTIDEKNTWAGITKFKLGFSQNIQPIVFPGSYDIVINPWKYMAYRLLQKAKSIIAKMQKMIYGKNACFN